MEKIEYEKGFPQDRALVQADNAIVTTFCSDSPSLRVNFDPAALPDGERYGVDHNGKQARWPTIKFEHGVFHTRSSKIIKFMRNHPQHTKDKGVPGFWEANPQDLAAKSGKATASELPSMTPQLNAAIAQVQKIPRKANNIIEQVKAITTLKSAYGIANVPPVTKDSKLAEVQGACYLVISSLQEIGVIEEGAE